MFELRLQLDDTACGMETLALLPRLTVPEFSGTLRLQLDDTACGIETAASLVVHFL